MERLSKTNDRSDEEFYHHLFNQLPGPVAVYRGIDLRIEYMNTSYRKIFDNKNLLGRRIREVFEEGSGREFCKILEEVYESGIPFHGIDSALLTDFHNLDSSRERWYQFVYTPYRLQDGSIDGIIAYGQDIRARPPLQIQTGNESRFRNIMEHSRDSILILKGEHLIFDLANEPVFKIWNVGKDVLGKRFLDILPEMKEQGFFDTLQNVYHNGTSHYGHETSVYFLRESGRKEIYYFNFVYEPFREPDQSISGVLVMATDVTEQVLLKQKLTQSEANFRNMILQAPIAICVLHGPQHNVAIANQSAYEILGREPESLMGQPIHIGLPELEGQGLLDLLNQVYKTGERFTASERSVNFFRHGSLETIYVNFVFEALRESDGIIAGIIGAGFEVTDQVLARKDSEYAEERARLAIGSADLGTYEINLETDEMITSPRFNAIWGFEHFTVNRREYAGVIHPDDLAVRAKAHQESFDTGNLHYEARVIWKNETIHWVKVRGRILYDNQQKPIWLSGVIQDITEQKLFAEELARNVTERTKSLRETNERLEHSNEELEQFAYITSHDMQEPLRKIQIYSNILLDGNKEELSPNALQMLEKVSGSAARMSALIRNLLNYSRIARGEILFEETNLNLIVKNVLSDFELMITQKKAVVDVEVLPLIQAVPLHMNQLFYNLIGNALKFSKKNTIPHICINALFLEPDEKARFIQLSSDKEYYKFLFQDNGIGFQQEYGDKIFTIFQKLNAQSMFGGYGIGLAICKKIVENHHGMIYATGKINEGALFTVILPAKQY